MVKSMDKIIECAKKPFRFVKRHYGKMLLTLGALGALALSGVGCFMFGRQGRAISGNLDGKIDSAYYHKLFLENPEVKGSELDDLLAEVYYLNTGKKLEDNFRFNFYNKEAKPLRVLYAEYAHKGNLAGMNWENGDLYIEQGEALRTLNNSFHEEGHGKRNHWSHFKSFFTRQGITEPIAEKNAVDSMIALMYINPEVGYYVYSDYIMTHFSHDSFLKDEKNRWTAAVNLNQASCIEKGELEIKQSYLDYASIIQETDRVRNSDETNVLIRRMYQGTLEMFRQRFGDRSDFAEKFARLRDYFEYGSTDNLYKKPVFLPITAERAERKEEFLKQQKSELIQKSVRHSLSRDYKHLGEVSNEKLLDKLKG